MLSNGRTAIAGFLARWLGAGAASAAWSAPGFGLPMTEPCSADRPADVLDLLIAEIRVDDLEPVADLIAHRRRDADSAGLGHGLEPRRDIDAVAEDVALLDDDIAEIDADAVEQRARGRHVPIAPRHALLKIDGATQRLGDALEFDQHAVAGRLDDAPPALGDRRIDEFEPDGLQPGKRSRFVHFHEAAIADHVGGDESRRAGALQLVGFHPINDHETISASAPVTTSCRSP